MFFLGLLLGVLLTLVLGGWWLLSLPSSSPMPDYRAAVADIERGTVHDLIAESLAAGSRPVGGDVIEGRAVERRGRS